MHTGCQLNLVLNLVVCAERKTPSAVPQGKDQSFYESSGLVLSTGALITYILFLSTEITDEHGFKCRLLVGSNCLRYCM